MKQRTTDPFPPDLSAFVNKPESPSAQVLRRAAEADLALTLAAWTRRHWNELPPRQRADLQFALYGGPFLDRQVAFGVPLSMLVEAIHSVR